MKRFAVALFVVSGCISIARSMNIEQKNTQNQPFKEIEIKFLLPSEAVSTLRQWLEKNAEHVRTEEHSEIYLDKPQETFFFTNDNNQKDAHDFLRIRTATSLNGTKSSVCFKKWHKNDQGIGTHCDESETKIDNPEIMLQIFTNLGYTRQTLIKKKRDIYIHDKFEIVIDDVETLGTFVEIELKVSTENVTKGREEIESLMKNHISIVDYKKINGGYPHLIWNPGKVDEYTY